MRADIVWWNLRDSAQTVRSLRAHLAEEGIREWAEVPGLHAKFWISDEDNGRWGAVMIWKSERPDAAVLPPNRAAELIGYPPTCRSQFEVEATVPGEQPCTSTWS